uniref:Uncharacterized protein n=1 Tax=Geobacter sp. (strain M21) TaxID=443144 RepID=C6E8X6_GEOSM
MSSKVKILSLLLLALLSSGCATTYVPVSWGFGDKVKQFSRSDLFLAMLFNRYDPDRSTLRVTAQSFDEPMMPSEVKYRLGAYRPDTKLIYRNLYQNYSDQQLRSLMLHELAHHVWYTGMTDDQRQQWEGHLFQYPSPLQIMVRRVYPRGSDFKTEDFAYTVEHARKVDIEALARIKVITEIERESLLKQGVLTHTGAISGVDTPTMRADSLSPGSVLPAQKGPDPAQ